MFKRVLVATDGSEPSSRAVETAAGIAERWDAELLVLTIIPKLMLPVFPNEGFGSAPMVVYRDLGQYQERMREIYQNALNEAVAKVKAAHPALKVVPKLEEGRPSATIVDAAQREGVDLIVMGSRGIGGITGWILGSTSRRVSETCTKPLLIVK